MSEEIKSENRKVASEEVLENLFELSQTLNTGLSKETLSNSLDLIDDGLDPSTLADVILALRDGKDQ